MVDSGSLAVLWPLKRSSFTMPESLGQVLYWNFIYYSAGGDDGRHPNHQHDKILNI